MSRKQRSGKGRGPGAPGQQGGQQQKPQGGQGQGAGGWGPLRDNVRREIEQAGAALAFAEKLHTRLDTQRRLFTDFPRVMEQLRSGALERVAGALGRLYEGGQGFDLTRFLRDLPLALAHLAAAEAQARRQAANAGAAKAARAPKGAGAAGGEQAPGAEQAAGGEAGAGEKPAASAEASTAEIPNAGTTPESATAPGDAASEGEGTSDSEAAPDAEAAADQEPAAGSEAAHLSEAAHAGEAAAGTNAAGTDSPAAGVGTAGGDGAEPAAGKGEGPVSPRLELRSKLLAAVPHLTRAAQAYRRSVSTVRRAAAPRRSPGPWRSDREILEEARRAVDFARQLFDAYADAWADQKLSTGADEAMAAEADRFLAWTQLNRYVELAVHGDPRHPSAPPPARKLVQPPVTEASPGAVVAEADAGPAQPEPTPES